VSNITLPRAVGLHFREVLICGKGHSPHRCHDCDYYLDEAVLAALDAALAEPEQKPDALRRWANANEDAPETEFQRGYDAARRWVREVGLPALAEPKKERAETGIPARGEIEVSTGKSYREHVTDGSPCWCNPELNYRDPETGAEVWVHRREQ
jgi:hypothetical protein